MPSSTIPHPVPSDERQILGINFYVGDVLARLSHGGLLVVPAAPVLKYVATILSTAMR